MQFSRNGLTRRKGLVGAAAALLSGCSATAALDALVPRDTYRARDGVAYGSLPRQRLDAYLPLEPTTDTALVVFFYGGNWTEGSRDLYRFVGEALASHGIVAVIADYRLSPEVRWHDILDDCAGATAWAHANARALGADPARLFVMGHSAGAYNAAMLALDPRWLKDQDLSPRDVAGWIGIAGPYDFLPISEPRSRVAFDWPDTPRDSQPVNHVSGGAPLALLLAAANDATVDPGRNSAGLARRLQAAGSPVKFELFERVSHATVIGAVARPLRFLAPVLDRVTDFVGTTRG